MLFTSRIQGLLLGGLLAVIGFGAGLWLAQSGFDEVQRLRQLERLPVSQRVGAVLPGDAALRAPVRTTGLVLRSPRTNTPSLYYRYRHEVETRDSDGKKRWETRTDRAEAVDFVLQDDSGSIRIPAQREFLSIEFSPRQRHQDTVGSNRYTEWRIEPGDPVVVFGRARMTPTGMEVSFRQAEGPAPIISAFTADAERQDLGRSGILMLWAGLALLALGVFGLALALRIHRVLAYLSLLSFVLALTIFQFGVQMMRADLNLGAEAQLVREAAARTRFEQVLARSGLPMIDIAELGSLSETRYTRVPRTDRDNLQAIREELESARVRARRQFEAFPERWLAPLFGVEPPRDTSFLPAAEQAAFAVRLAARPPTQITDIWALPLAIVGLVAALGLTWLGFGRVRVKRYIENLATSLSSGASCGLTELSGIVEMPEDAEPLTSPLTQSPCSWFDYHVEEKRKSGKNTSWHTIERRTEHAAFLCRDSEGALRVEPEGAEVISRHTSTRREGKLRYTERRLEIGDACYALGLARVHGEQADRLALTAGDLGEPFLLSNLPEQAVMLRKGFAGLSLLNLALTALTLALLLGLATLGSFSPADFLLAALAAPVYMFGVMLVLHYNDLLFLRERARRNWSNIQISLRKRRNLVRPLNAIVSKYLEHERELQEKLARMRTEMRTATDDPASAARYLAAEADLDTSFRVAIEAYPKLKGARAVGQLMEALTRLENEIALMRAGYNDAVEHYNARTESFPDLLLARALRFARMDLLAF